MPLTAGERLAGVIGQVIVENAYLGEEIERLRQDLAREKSRADVAEALLNDYQREKAE